MTDFHFKTPKKSMKKPHISSDFLPNSSKFFRNGLYKSRNRVSNLEKDDFYQRNRMLESPFCRLLNESEREPFEKYQILTFSGSFGKESEKFTSFFDGFNSRNPEILNLFVFLSLLLVFIGFSHFI